MTAVTVPSTVNVSTPEPVLVIEASLDSPVPAPVPVAVPDASRSTDPAPVMVMVSTAPVVLFIVRAGMYNGNALLNVRPVAFAPVKLRTFAPEVAGTAPESVTVNDVAVPSVTNVLE